MKWQDIEGWFSEADAQFVKEICKDIHDGIVVELGFFAGRCTAALAPVCKNNHNTYWAVDNCIGGSERDPATKAQKSRDMEKVFNINMENSELLAYINIQIIDSVEFSQMFEDKRVDFCFVDASHVAEDVKKDIEAWWPKIKPGGVLGGHDYSWGSVCGVTNAFAKEHGLDLVVSGNCWKMKKPMEVKV